MSTLADRVRALRIPRRERRWGRERWWISEIVVAAVVVLIVAGVAFLAIDRFGGEWESPISATVIQKVYRPSHSSSGVGTVIGSNGQVGTAVVSSSEPEEWKLLVTTYGGQTFSLTCDSNQWGQLKEGHSVQVQQKLGWITGAGVSWRIAQCSGGAWR